MKKVIITGASGMVGKAVLLECLADSRIEKILLINRKPLNINEDKVTEIVLNNFSHLNQIEQQLNGYDGCFYCMGVSVAGLSEEKYTEITYDITKIFADLLWQKNPKMVFNYISGAGTDSSEQGRVMWARVKGKTENMVLKKGFKDAYIFRAGAILPEKGIKSNTALYNWSYIITKPLFPLFRKMKNITTTTLFGKAMVNTLFFPQENKILHNPDINKLAKISSQPV